MPHSLKAAALLSIALHILLFNLFTRVRLSSSPIAQPIAIEFKDSTGVDVSRAASRSPPASRAKALPLKSLIPRLALNPPAHQDFTRDPDESTASMPSPGGTGSGELSAPESRFIMTLWRMVDQYVEENPFLSEYNQTGKVTLRFDIDEQGQISNLRASTDSRVLKVIAARALRKAVVNETGDVRFPPKKMSIVADFHWTSYEMCRTRRGHSGNTLSFCHYAENKRKKFSSGERIGTWASAIYNYGPWAYEEIQKYNREERRRKAQFNPFRKYELDPDWNL